MFTTEKEVAVTVRVLGKEAEGTMKHTFPKAKEHVLPIVGLYGGYKNKVEIELYRGAKTTIEIETAPLADTVPKLIVNSVESYSTSDLTSSIVGLPDFKTYACFACFATPSKNGLQQGLHPYAT